MFQKIIEDNNIEKFKYKNILQSMCKLAPQERIDSFRLIKKQILEDQFTEYDFTYVERESYGDFAQALSNALSKIEEHAKYYTETDKLIQKLEDLYKSVLLEEYIPTNVQIIRCFIDGAYYYSRNYSVSVQVFKAFLDLLRANTQEKRNIIIRNLHSRLDAIPRYEEEVPF